MCDSVQLFRSGTGTFSESSHDSNSCDIIDHTTLLSKQYKILLESKENYDVVLIVDDKKFKAHRLILATQCEYFRALFYGGMRESDVKAEDITLHDTPSCAFENVMSYLYCGLLSLKELKEEDAVDVLGLAHRYGLRPLEMAVISYLESIISVSNVVMIFNAAALYNYPDLLESCHTFLDHNAMEILASGLFNTLTIDAAESVLQRDSFCAPEIEIFRCAQSWILSNNPTNPEAILNTIRLPLISLHELFDEVRPSNLYLADHILDAIQEKTECTVSQLPFRGHLVENENVAKRSNGTEVIEGELPDALFDNQLSISTSLQENDQGFTRHVIEQDSQGIVIALGRPSIINTITFHLWDRDARYYSYKLFCSVDKSDWTCISDYSDFQCRSLQSVSFPSRVVRYVRLLGTHSSANRYLHLMSMRCYHLLNPTRMLDGYVVPFGNVASTLCKASVVEGVSRNRNALIDGDTDHYDWESGYTCHQIGSGCIIIHLAQPFCVSTMRMLLWDCDDRSYSYYVEVSLDAEHWEIVTDEREKACRGWQEIEFEQRPVSFIKIVGTRNTANEVFHVVHFECPSEGPSSPARSTISIKSS